MSANAFRRQLKTRRELPATRIVIVRPRLLTTGNTYFMRPSFAAKVLRISERS
jgi:hypothetical protein